MPTLVGEIVTLTAEPELLITVICWCVVANLPLASVTLTQKNFETVEVGVPVIVPVVELSANPAGRLPSEMAKLYGAVPPLASITPEYGAPTTPVGKVVTRVKDQLGAA